jgi:hypothetical protein
MLGERVWVPTPLTSRLFGLMRGCTVSMKCVCRLLVVDPPNVRQPMCALVSC